MRAKVSSPVLSEGAIVRFVGVNVAVPKRDDELYNHFDQEKSRRR